MMAALFVGGIKMVHISIGWFCVALAVSWFGGVLSVYFGAKVG